MSTATRIRKDFLQDSAEVLDEIRRRMLGKKSKFPSADGDFLLKYWDAIIPILQQADDPTPLAKLTDGDITQRVDAVLEEVASGDITPNEGKKLIGLLQAGFDITELPKLIEKLNDLETA